MHFSVINLIICFPVHVHVSCVRDMTKHSRNEYFPWEPRYQTEPQSEIEKIALSRKNWDERSESMHPKNIEQKL